MSDLNKLFENAPEGAVEIKVKAYESGLLRIRPFNANGQLLSDACNEWVDADEGWETIATRPQPEQPRKTVEDAVRYFDGKWPSDDFIGIAYCSDENKFIPYMKGSPIDLGERKSRKAVCTREEFEACVAAKAAKSEPEWTHLVNGSECALLDPNKDCDGYYIAKTHYGAFELAKEHELEPIKPKITKAEAWDKICESEHEFDIINRVKQLYTITD